MRREVLRRRTESKRKQYSFSFVRANLMRVLHFFFSLHFTAAKSDVAFLTQTQRHNITEFRNKKPKKTNRIKVNETTKTSTHTVCSQRLESRALCAMNNVYALHSSTVYTASYCITFGMATRMKILQTQTNREKRVA